MKRDRMRKFTLAGAALAALAGLGWVLAMQGPLAPVKVTTAQAAVGTLQPTAFGIGTVEARRSYALGPTLAGRVARVLVDQGDRVRAGQLLAEMEPVDLDQRVIAARAAAARSSRNVEAARAQLAEAGSRAQQAQATARRYEDLHAREFVSREAVDVKRHEADAAQAAVDAARAALAAARADADRSAAETTGAGHQRAQLRLVAPVDGVVTARLVEPGTTLVGGQAVLTLIDPASLWIKTRVDQRRSQGLALGQPAEITLRSNPTAVLRGAVARLDWINDAVTEERIVDIAFAQTPPAASIGELAEVTVQLPSATEALWVPSAAVKRAGQSDVVWLLEEGRARQREVKAGVRTTDGRTQIIAGLQVGETVLVHSARLLAEDMRVRVVDTLVAGAR
ncbi:MAG TPA: efflux RND transporter periplasmic adaptor subunit [Burkholderiaceae bacterium]|nr:efflux RND transporter periplasmic adaptor subunit [Burkholderiaceae bacterium]